MTTHKEHSLTVNTPPGKETKQTQFLVLTFIPYVFPPYDTFLILHPPEQYISQPTHQWPRPLEQYMSQATHRWPRVIVVAEVFSLYPGFLWHSQNSHRYSLSIDCIARKGRRESPCQGGSQTRGAAGRSGSPSVRRRTEVRWLSFPWFWPTWISRPRHLRGLPPWPTTSAQASNRTAGRYYGSEVGWQPCRGVDRTWS